MGTPWSSGICTDGNRSLLKELVLPLSPVSRNMNTMEIPAANMLSAMAARMMSALSLRWKYPSRAARPTPAAIPASSASQRLCVKMFTSTPAQAATIMMPSRAMFVAPDNDEMATPSAGNSSGVMTRRIAKPNSGDRTDLRRGFIPRPPSPGRRARPRAP